MARNAEKNLTELNRLWLSKQPVEISYTFVVTHDNLEDTDLKRPQLDSLTSAAEVKKWIPMIKKEIYYCVRHMSGIRNYPEYKIKEFEERADRLKRELKAWIARCIQLDPDVVHIAAPGSYHGYVSKRKLQERKEAAAKRAENPFLYDLMNADDAQFNANPEEFFGEKPPEDLDNDEEYGHRSKHIKLDTPLLEKEQDEPKEEPKRIVNGHDIDDYSTTSRQNQPLAFAKTSSYKPVSQPPPQTDALSLLAQYSESDED